MKTVSRNRQSGSFILEAMISVLILMVGLIALLGVATQATNQLSQSKYRNDASYLADELIGEMWVTQGTAAAYLATANFADWQNRVATTLPGGAASAVMSGTDQIALDISWPDKKDPGVTHHYQTTANISKNN